jgi:SAM-dependent methyltransferase
MKIQKTSLHILDYASIFSLFNTIIGGRKTTALILKDAGLQTGDAVLDIGCGTCDILDSLPKVYYTGFDINKDYIKNAAQRHGQNGKFICSSITNFKLQNQGQFDVVLALGVLHHLNDDLCKKLFLLSFSALKKGGKLITLDGVWTKRQNPLSKLVMSLDRGKFIRTKDSYLKLAKKVFVCVDCKIYQNALSIPYQHLIMSCRK